MVSEARILVVDDELSILRYLQKLLGRHGYRVFIASSAAEAIKILETVEVDLVITDYKMPKVTGIDLVRHIKENFKNTVVLMITGHATIGGAVQAVKYGAQEYLAKPFSNEEMLAAIENALETLRLYKVTSPEASPAVMPPPGMIGNSEPVLTVFRTIDKAAKTAATVLITGESGTGKELVARAIHHLSPRKTDPFIAVNCGGIPEELLNGELFGYTGEQAPAKPHPGLFHTAQGGTIFLDGVGNLSHSLQTKLLRVLEDKEVFTPAGPQKIDVRILAATNSDLLNMISKGAFRQDLYYRLNVISISIPPLRELGEDIILLAHHFLERFSRDLGRSAPPKFSDHVLRILKSYYFPGNVRELENLIQQLVVMSEGDTIGVTELPAYMRYSAVGEEKRMKTLAEMEKEYILNVLANSGGNKSQAAEILGIDRKTLREKLKKIGEQE